MFKILLIDNDDTTRTYISRVISKLPSPPVELVSTRIGSGELRSLKRQRFDLVISSVRSPERLGVCAVAMARSAFKCCPILAMVDCTPEDGKWFRKRLRQAGAMYQMHAPFQG